MSSNHTIDLCNFTSRVSLDAKQAISQIQDYLNMSLSPYYFPEYTIHGIPHINNLIKYSWELLHPETYDQLSNDAVSALIIGICMHDIGMFITEKMFESLLDISEWKTKFEEFIAKSNNFTFKRN